MRQVSPQGTGARGCGCPSHLTCRPLCSPGWPRCTRGGDSGAAARRWLGVCRTSRTSSVLRERAGDMEHPLPCQTGTFSVPGSWVPQPGGEQGSAAPGWEIPSLPSASWSQAGWHPHPTAAASTEEKNPPALCPPITPQKEKRNAASHLKTRRRRGRGALGERGAGGAAAPARPGLR